jgi:phosphohistidine phosphatase
MNLYLVQHADAVSKEEDPDRPLSARGRADASKVARYIKDHRSVLAVDQIFHSSKTRAKQTAQVLSQALDLAGNLKEDPDLGGGDDPAIWARRLAELDQNVMLVGHMPHLRKLVSLLLCGDPAARIIDFQNSGIVHLHRAEDNHWTVRWIITPAII